MSYKQIKGGTSGARKHSTSFWYDQYDDGGFDYLTEYGGYSPDQLSIFKKSHNLYKLSSVRRAIANFVQIVTGKSIPVTFATKSESKTDGQKVILSADVDDNFDVSVGLALHEGSHIVLSDFGLLKAVHDIHTEYGRLSRRIAMENKHAEAEGKALPYPNVMEQMDKMIDSVIHSTTDTNKYSKLLCDLFLTTGRFKNTEPLNETTVDTIRGLTNWIEDRRIDYHIFKSAPGYRDYYTTMYDYYFNDKGITKGVDSDEFTEETLDSYMFRIINLMNEKTNLSKLNGLRKIYRMLDLKNISRLKSSSDSMELAMDIMEVILTNVGQNPEYQNPQNQPGNGGQGEGDGEIEITDVVEGDGSGQMGGSNAPIPNGTTGTMVVDTSGNPSNATGNTNANVKLSKTALDKLQKLFDKQKKFLNGDVKKKSVTKEELKKLSDIAESDSELVRVGTDIQNGYGKKIGKGVDCIVVKKLTDNLLVSDDFPFSHSHDGDARAWAQEHVNRGITLGKLLGKKLQVRSESRETIFSRLKKGKIDKRLVASLGFDNEGVFYTNEIDQYKKANLHISLDYSGSMSGNKLNRTITATIAIAKACEMARNVNVQISIRSTDSTAGNRSLPYICMIYDSRRDSFRRLCKYMSILDANNTTPEGLCFEAIHKYLIPNTNDTDSYFLNFSDGQPCFSIHSGSDDISYNGSAAAQHTNQQVKKMRAAGINVLSYFITNAGEHTFEQSGDWDMFKRCYDKSAKYVNVENVTQVAKTMNDLFLQKTDNG